jgi:hypothetical protein
MLIYSLTLFFSSSVFILFSFLLLTLLKLFRLQEVVQLAGTTPNKAEVTSLNPSPPLLCGHVKKKKKKKNLLPTFLKFILHDYLFSCFISLLISTPFFTNLDIYRIQPPPSYHQYESLSSLSTRTNYHRDGL